MKSNVWYCECIIKITCGVSELSSTLGRLLEIMDRSGAKPVSYCIEGKAKVTITTTLIKFNQMFDVAGDKHIQVFSYRTRSIPSESEIVRGFTCQYVDTIMRMHKDIEEIEAASKSDEEEKENDD